MPTTVAELHGLMRCYGSALFLRGLWSNIAGGIADVHIRTDANNLVTTASTTRQPEQKETMHLIQMLRKESNSGQMHNLAQARSKDCLADPLTKHSAKADEPIKAVLTGNLMNVDAHPPFRTMLQNKKFLVEWLAHKTKHGPDPTAFAGVGIAEPMFACWGTWQDPRVHECQCMNFPFLVIFNAVMSILHVTCLCLEPQEICVCVRSQFVRLSAIVYVQSD